MEKIMSGHKIGGSYFYYSWLLEEARISYWQKVKGMQNTFADNLNSAAEQSTLDFLMKLYGKIEDIAFYKRSFNIEAKGSIFGEVVKNINFTKIAEECIKSGSKNAKFIEFFCNVILCITQSEKEEHFYRVREFFFKNHKIFETDEKRNLVTILENNCLNRTRRSYRNELFELHEFRLRHDILTYENGKFNKMLYTQIVNNALTLEKTEWVTNFVKQYTPMLTKEHQRTMKSLANAFISFKLKKYTQTLDNLGKVEFIDTRDKVHVKNLMARTLYEMKEYEQLLNHIDSSKHFLKNNEHVSDAFKESYGNFYHYLHKIILTTEKNEDLKPLIDKLTQEKKISHKNWLIEKAGEINT